jgi:DNA ligase-1
VHELHAGLLARLPGYLVPRSCAKWRRRRRRSRWVPSRLEAAIFQGQADVALYLVSEKLDGVRAFWDGQALRTRKGHTIQVPSWFVAQFPAQPLDGELWIGRGEFERLSGIVRRQTPDDSQWQQVRYLVFELPQSPGTFRQRALALRELTARLALPWLQAVEQWEFGSREALEKKLEQIVRGGGEGLMLHRADAAYVTGRSDVLLKLKAWQAATGRHLDYLPLSRTDRSRAAQIRQLPSSA